MSKIVIKETKTEAARRVPPGDRWSCVFDGADSSIIFESLTDTLQYIFQETSSTKFFMNSKEGFVYIINTKEEVVKPVPKKTYSLYGED